MNQQQIRKDLCADLVGEGWRVDPFHMPTGLADGLGVESLPRRAAALRSPMCPGHAPGWLPAVTTRSFGLALGSPRLRMARKA